MAKISFSQMKQGVVYTSLSPKGLFCKMDEFVWFKSYYNGAQYPIFPVRDSEILEESEYIISIENQKLVFPKSVTLK